MYEANATVIGTIVNHPVRRDLSNGEQVLTFRMASNSRRLDHTTGEWVDNGTLFLTVSCWRRLVAGVEASLRRGDPVLAYGQLRSREYRGKDGMARRDLEMRATAVGPDLARCTAQVTRWSAERWTDEPAPALPVAASGVLSDALPPEQPSHPVTQDEALPAPV
ncbi:single-stranded DNA-binding protein [Nocardia brasiliensis]|uniref:Single-stranded DNA-binding protein n=1 Tax=Nocardia brasiliensis TaxID=37326 RepID=A0A6G9XNE1_NOCBR|nr:single-stranded DNA-binding protein [Nocardia brasiliensis]QIS02363.1 single-stranded DNA-binding protein [Nocardia brasiliensis]